MNCLGKNSMIGKFSLFFKCSFICMVTILIMGGCRTPALLKGAVERPHSKMECSTCHKSHDDLPTKVEKGEGDEPYVEKGGLLKSDLNGICLGCHEPGKEDHAIAEVPKVNRHNLPLGPDGRITCAVTCHNVHTNSDDPAVINGLLRLHPNELCLSCHDL